MYIVTVTGPAGSGKTSIVRRLLTLQPSLRLVKSFTSRSARSSDLPGEYHYEVPKEDFERGIREHLFLWTITAHGNTYGTTRISVEEALQEDLGVSLMILTPEAIMLLRQHFRHNVFHFYVRSPGPEELQRRMRARGETEVVIEKRLRDCESWDAEAKHYPLLYSFITNDIPVTGIETAAREIERRLIMRNALTNRILPTETRE